MRRNSQMDRTHQYERCNENKFRTRCLLELNWSWFFVVFLPNGMPSRQFHNVICLAV